LNTFDVLHNLTITRVQRCNCLELFQPSSTTPPLSSFLLSPHPHPMSFTQKLQLVRSASTLPLQIDFGRYSCSWENGKFQFGSEQDFRALSRDELLHLMRRLLHAAPHAVLLNLANHRFGRTLMQEMAAPMAALSKLQVLVLPSACLPPYRNPYCNAAFCTSGLPPASTPTTPPQQVSPKHYCNIAVDSLFFVALRALFFSSFVRSPSLTQLRQLHRRRRLHCAVVIFGPSFSFESTASLR
jgi:hypothetical protein